MRLLTTNNIKLLIENNKNVKNFHFENIDL